MSAAEAAGEDVPLWARSRVEWDVERVGDGEIRVWSEATITLPARARADGWSIACANSAGDRTYVAMEQA